MPDYKDMSPEEKAEHMRQYRANTITIKVPPGIRMLHHVRPRDWNKYILDTLAKALEKDYGKEAVANLMSPDFDTYTAAMLKIHEDSQVDGS